ncbi:hypothetical protein AB0368_25250 [Actinoplanes sp. NPDC051475]|uniref:hypothetical protein n=1 Tax=Actinoplanes sp. NPDC051475 TaxID=3157225 RepID=UPI00344D2F0F
MSAADGFSSGQPAIEVGFPAGYAGWGEVRLTTNSALHIWLADVDRLWMCLHRARQLAFCPKPAIDPEE